MTYNDLDPDRNPKLSDPVLRDESSGWAMMGVVAAVAVAMVAGFLYFSTGDGTDSTASNKESGVTTGSSPPAPAPKATPEKQ